MNDSQSPSRKQRAADRRAPFVGASLLKGTTGVVAKKSFALVMALLLLLQTVQWTGNQQAAAAPISTDIIKKVVMVTGHDYDGDIDFVTNCFNAPQTSCAPLITHIDFSAGGSPVVYNSNFEASIGQSSYPFTLIYEWQLTEADAVSGGTYEFLLPEGLVIPALASGSIGPRPLGLAGTYMIEPAAPGSTRGKVVITFVNQTGIPGQLDSYNYRGALMVSAWLDEGLEVVEKEIEVRIPITTQASDDVIINIPVDFGSGGPGIVKTRVGSDKTPNTSKVFWQLDINTVQASVYNASFIDTLPPELTLDSASLAIYPLIIDMNNNKTPGTLIPGPYNLTGPSTVAGDTNTPPATYFSVDLGNITSAYRVTFTTDVHPNAEIDEDGITVINEAALHGSLTSGGPAVELDDDSANVELKRGKMLEKSRIGAPDHESNHETTWSVLFNRGHLPHTNPVLSDVVPLGHQLIASSIVVTETKTAEPDTGQTTVWASDTPSTPGANGTYTLTNVLQDPLNPNSEIIGFTIRLNGSNITSEFKIDYVTENKVNNPIAANETESGVNEVSYVYNGKTYEDDAEVTYSQRAIQKSGSVIDYASKIITWTIDINDNNYWFKATAANYPTLGDPAIPLRITDTFANKGLQYIDGSLKIFAESAPGAAISSGNYSFSKSAEATGALRDTGFTITFDSSYDIREKHTVTYQTYYDYDWFDAPANPVNARWSPTNYSLDNDAVFSWGELGYNSGTSIAPVFTRVEGPDSQDDDATVTPGHYTSQNGNKTGVYNAVSKEIDWEILFNYHNEEVPNAVITDTLEEGQELPGATLNAKLANIVVHEMTLAADGTLTEGALLTREIDYVARYVAPDFSNQANPVNGQVIIRFINPAEADPANPQTTKLIKGPHRIQLKTTMQGKVIPDRIDNTAIFTSDDPNYRATLTSDVRPTYGDEFVNKTFSNTGRLANWTLWANRSQSHFEEIVIEDRPDEQQTLAEESFVLTKFVSDTTGNFSGSGTAMTRIEPGDTPGVNTYSLEFKEDTGTKRKMFVLTIHGPTDAAYQLTYETLLSAKSTASIGNRVDFQGESFLIHSSTDYSSELYSVVGVGTSGFTFPNVGNYTGSLEITKVAEDNGALLDGAQFTITSESANLGDSDYRTFTGTTVNGVVTFTNLPFGEYKLVEVTAPTGYEAIISERTISISSTTQQEIEIENRSIEGQIGNYVWLDLNYDGIQDSNEPGVQGVTVILYDASDSDPANWTEVDRKTTDVNGAYLFDELELGHYVVEFVWGDDYALTLPEQGNDDGKDSHLLNTLNRTDVIEIRRGALSDLTIDLGLIKKGRIGNYVWLDRDRDGIQDEAAINGLNGIEVVLYEVVGGTETEIARTTTRTFAEAHALDSSTAYAAGQPGYYLFEHLESGTYVVEFLVPISYKTTDEEIQGSTTANDSNATTTNGTEFTSSGQIVKAYKTAPITIGYLNDNWTNYTIDLGLVGLGTIGDFVWLDKNNNGAQDPGEPGVPGIEVKLFRNGVEIDSQITDSNGKYLFEHLTEGSYYVWFETPDIYKLTSFEDALAGQQYDSNSIHTSGTDKGLTVNPIPLGHEVNGVRVWEDLTIDLGFIGHGSLGDRVWHDYDWDGTPNEDLTIFGINGVTVNLFKDSPTGTPYATTVTADDSSNLPGHYLFTDLPDGTYYVQFIYPPEYRKTIVEDDPLSNYGSNWTDNNGITRAIVIGENEPQYGRVNPSIDLGLVAQGSIGNYVWLDWNRNGLQDEADEHGLNNVEVRLYRNTPTGPVHWDTIYTADDNNGNPGYYLFNNLPEGDYYVQVILPDSNYEVTTDSIGSNDEEDSNWTDATGRTALIPIGPGAPKGWQDLTIDFGLVRKGSIGNFVWQDRNRNGIQDEDLLQWGMNGIVVKLYDSSRNYLTETVTANKNGDPGYYLFDHLVEGDYYVQFIRPSGFLATKPSSQGSTIADDSNPVNSNGYTDVIAIGPGAPQGWHDLTIDQGYVVYVPPVFPFPTEEPEETEEPGETPEPTPTPDVTPTPGPTTTPGATPTPGPTTTPGTTPTPTPVIDRTDEEVPVEGEVDVPGNGTTEIKTPPAHGTVTITPDGKWVYTPDPGFVGKDTFSVIIINEDGEEEEIWFEIDVDEIPRGNIDATPDVNTLPKTGQSSYLLLYLLGLAFIGGGVLLQIKRKRSAQ